MNKYHIKIIPLNKKDGGGYLGIVLELKGCISDGETIQETLINTKNAIKEWITAQNKFIKEKKCYLKH